MTQPRVAHEPISLALRWEPRRVVAQRMAVPSPATIAITGEV
jgi:hypothetical protein